MQLGRTKIITQKRTRILSLFPDTCTIKTRSRVRNTAGQLSDVKGLPLIYNGSQDIPCRIDISNRYTTTIVGNQEGTVNQFILHVPFDCPVIADCTVTHDGHDYEIMQIMDDESYRITKTAVISRID